MLILSRVVGLIKVEVEMDGIVSGTDRLIGCCTTNKYMDSGAFFYFTQMPMVFISHGCHADGFLFHTDANDFYFTQNTGENIRMDPCLIEI